jgi:hypothetical protein
MIRHPQAIGIEINPKLIGVLFTERIGNTLRLFCCYTNGDTSQLDVPAEENLENLRTLFSSLNLDPNCTSLILDEMVRGRIYLKGGDQHWLYTLLKTPGDTQPPLNADLGQLPWRVIWWSQEAEILRCDRTGNSNDCFAVRTRISENDATRLMNNSKAFTHPVSISRKQPQRWKFAKVAFATLAGGILLGAPIIYSFKQSSLAATPSMPSMQTAATAAARTVSGKTGYYLLINHRISGPYTTAIIAEMNSGGLLGTETLCRPENSADWIKLDDVPLPQPPK